MFLSYNNSDHENPPESLLLKKSPFFHHQHLDDHQDLKQYDDHHYHHHQPPFFSDFPSPFFDEHELIMPLNQYILPHTMPPAKPESNLIKNIYPENPTKPETAKRAVKSASTKLKQKTNDDDKRRNPGKRIGKKDRHSKIRTAQGVRDRRMRLSLQIARKFFDLQDMLGYDKASSTIEWLFGKSKKSIKELMTATKGGNNNSTLCATDGKIESFLSEYEAVSGVEVSSGNRRLGRKKSRKPNNNARESREKARARARWRTREKMRVKLGFQSNPSRWVNFCYPSNYCQDDPRLGFCNDQLGVVDQGLSWNYTSQLSQDHVGNSSASNNFLPVYDNYQSCLDPNSSNLMEFLGDWDLLSNGDDRLNSSQFTVANQVSTMAEKVNSNYSDYSAPNFPLFRQ